MKDEIKPIEPRRLRSCTVSDTSISSTSSAIVHYCRKHQLSTTYISQINFVSVHSPVPPKEIANCSRPQIHISEEEADEIRLTFHLFLSQKLYPIPDVYLVIYGSSSKFSSHFNNTSVKMREEACFSLQGLKQARNTFRWDQICCPMCLFPPCNQRFKT